MYHPFHVLLFWVTVGGGHLGWSNWKSNKKDSCNDHSDAKLVKMYSAFLQISSFPHSSFLITSVILVHPALFKCKKTFCSNIFDINLVKYVQRL